jgi:hypothetical protein
VCCLRSSEVNRRYASRRQNNLDAPPEISFLAGRIRLRLLRFRPVKPAPRRRAERGVGISSEMAGGFALGSDHRDPPWPRNERGGASVR